MNIPARWRGRIAILLPVVSLAMGLWSAFFVVRRYDQARRLAWLLAAMWIFLALLAITRREIRRSDARWKRVVAFVLAWVGQSASQEILFFVLPFWIRSTTWSSPNAAFTVLLIGLAATVVVDPCYQWILKHLRLAMLHKSIVQFSALAFLVPTITGVRTLGALGLAGAMAGLIAAIATRFHRPWIAIPVWTLAGSLVAVAASPWIAPVPIRLEHAVFTSMVSRKIPSDTLASATRGQILWAWTPVFAPNGLRDSLVHEWSRDGRNLSLIRLEIQGGRAGGFRTWSSSVRAASEAGLVQVEARTISGQIVGRMTIPVN